MRKSGNGVLEVQLPLDSPSDIGVFTLQSDEIESAWGWIERFLSKVPSYDWTVPDVKRDLLSAKAQLWGLIGEKPLVQGIVVTRIEDYYEKRYGVIWIASGSGIEEGMPLLDHIEKWFIYRGCGFSQVVGRKGWGKVLPGYEERARVYTKELK
jgi:hypothetical protein